MNTTTFNKYLACLIAIIMLISSCMVVAAEDTTNPRLTITSAVCYPGTTTQLLVSIENNPGITNLVVYLNYDNTYISLTEVNDMNMLGTASHSSNLTDLPYRFCWSNPDSTVDNKITGPVVQFTVSVADKTPVGAYPISVYIGEAENTCNSTKAPVAFEPASGKIIVRSKSPATNQDTTGNTGNTKGTSGNKDTNTPPKPVEPVVETGIKSEVTENGLVLSLSKKKISLIKGTSETAKVNASKVRTSLLWETSNPKIATVNDKGKITAVDYGQCIIRCKAENDPKAILNIPVNVYSLATEINIICNNKDITDGDLGIDSASKDTTVQLTAKAKPDTASNEVVWKSANEHVATVNENGVVTAVDEGQTVLTVIAADGSGKKAYIRLDVAKLVHKIEIVGAADAASGRNVKLSTIISPDEVSFRKLNWSTSDKNIATVDSTGNVTAKKVKEKQKVTITATASDYSGVSASVDLDIYPLTEKVFILIDDASLGNQSSDAEKSTLKKDVTGTTQNIDLMVSKQLKLYASTMPEQVFGGITWVSDNPKVATVDEAGVVNAISSGTANISAVTNDSSKKKSTVKINVCVLAKSIKITAPAYIASGKTVNLTADVLPVTTTNKKITWISSDNSIAGITSGGVVTAKKVTEKKKVSFTALALDGSDIIENVELYIIPMANEVKIMCNDEDITNKTVKVKLKDGETVLAGKILPEDAEKDVNWKSSNNSIATISEEGKITFLKSGTVTITCTSEDGSKKAAKTNFIIS
ncbi:MAG: Ig-like domain-containing protein [Bacillota bacterium]|nr:Ig-like domain-containing protein [Bacillota bacterium]